RISNFEFRNSRTRVASSNSNFAFRNPNFAIRNSLWGEMYKGSRVAVVVPIHNEEAQLNRAIERIPAYVDLIIAVDDGSTDSTWELLNRLENTKLVRLKHEANRGVGAATRSGYKWALRTDVDFVAVMDGDGQMDGR